jgi:hypothetical protein
VPINDNEAWTSSLGFTAEQPWRPWLVNQQVAGYVTKYNSNFAFASVKGGAYHQMTVDLAIFHLPFLSVFHIFIISRESFRSVVPLAFALIPNCVLQYFLNEILCSHIVSFISCLHTAGHMVPQYRPEEAFNMVSRFLANEDL